MFRFILKWSFFLLLSFATYAAIDGGWANLGSPAKAERKARMEQSKLYKDGQFHNPEPLYNDYLGMFGTLFERSEYADPSGPVPTAGAVREALAAPASDLRVTWLGHSTTLIELEGHRFLTDPVWSERTTPVHFIGPKRYYPPLIALSDLGKLDAVLISHDHYDHLDADTVRALSATLVPFVVPLGVGAHLESFGVPAAQIIEIEWWQRHTFAEVELVMTPSRHASGRYLFDQDSTLWASYALLGKNKRVWFSGDTGLFNGMRKIGEELGPFDVVLIEIGQYGRAWPDWHIGPEQAVRAVQMLRGKVMFPIHWALFTLAMHGWTEPAERAFAAATLAKVPIVLPKPGEPVGLEHLTTGATEAQKWWPSLPFRHASEDPIVGTKVD